MINSKCFLNLSNLNMMNNPNQNTNKQIDKIMNVFNNKYNQIKCDIDLKMKDLIQSTIKDMNDFLIKMEDIQINVSKTKIKKNHF